MKAVSLAEPKKVQMVEIPEPEVGPEDVLVDVKYIGLCGSDLNAYRGQIALVTYPRIPGHEVSGIIVAKGDKVPDSFKVGNKMMLSPYSNCGICPACRVGRPNCCQYNETLGVQRDGALTDKIAVPYEKVFVSESLSLRELALVEPMSVGYHAANRGRISEVDTVLVIGAGTIGTGVIVAAARKGATVIAMDIFDAKLENARRFGAEYTINSANQDVKAEIAKLTDDEGVRVVVEAVGLPQTFRLATEVVCYAGRVVYIGYAKKEVTYDTTDFVRKELDIRGSRNALRVFPAVIQMIEKGRWPFEELITKVYPFEESAQAFADWDAAPGDYNKVMIAV
jgi:2-desacetyl-2-hydroxyethyl bacteriochlorophyllide A dehydrogenase